MGGRFSKAGGGKGANWSVAAARAGGSVTFISKDGDDVFGAQVREGFTRDGISTAYVGKDSGVASGVALILVDEKGENCIAVASGANAELTSSEAARARDAYRANFHTSEFVPSFTVNVIDTTAAGDVFCGTLAVSLAEGRSLREAVRFANAAAALSVTRLGAQPSVSFRSEIEEFLITLVPITK